MQVIKFCFQNSFLFVHLWHYNIPINNSVNIYANLTDLFFSVVYMLLLSDANIKKYIQLCENAIVEQDEQVKNVCKAMFSS